LGISRGEAEKYIKNYFARYAGVRRFIDATIERVRRRGDAHAVRTRAAHPRINSRKRQRARFAERTAVNRRCSTAADLIKLAMVRIDAALRAGGYRSAMLVQVHDDWCSSARRRSGGRLETGEARDGRGLPTERAAGGGCGVGDNGGMRIGSGILYPREGQMASEGGWLLLGECLLGGVVRPAPFREYPGVEYSNFPIPKDWQEKTEWVYAR